MPAGEAPVYRLIGLCTQRRRRGVLGSLPRIVQKLIAGSSPPVRLGGVG
jgi:hypothetical protein